MEICTKKTSSPGSNKGRSEEAVKASKVVLKEVAALASEKNVDLWTMQAAPALA